MLKSAVVILYYLPSLARYFYACTVHQPFQAAAIGLSAVIRGLYESDKVAIVRYVFRNKAAPKIGFLSPHIKENYEASKIFIGYLVLHNYRMVSLMPEACRMLATRLVVKLELLCFGGLYRCMNDGNCIYYQNLSSV